VAARELAKAISSRPFFPQSVDWIDTGVIVGGRVAGKSACRCQAVVTRPGSSAQSA
jgi:hypothetical protein